MLMYLILAPRQEIILAILVSSCHPRNARNDGLLADTPASLGAKSSPTVCTLHTLISIGQMQVGTREPA
jgi:hypothetical protein